MLGATKALSVPAALFGAGVITIVVVSVMVLTLLMQRRATRQWGDTNPQDKSYAATFQRTFYRAYRVKFYNYAVGAGYLIGVGLVIASGIVKWFG